jgi:hypothetical protein
LGSRDVDFQEEDPAAKPVGIASQTGGGKDQIWQGADGSFDF